ncbi:MAG: esterase/lipase family protein [Actinomycetes bacterium]
MLEALSPQRRRAVLGAGGLALLLMVVLTGLVAVRTRGGGSAPVPQDVPGPVLLVPGYGGNLSSLAPLAEALRSAGRTPVLVAPVGNGTGDLRVQAAHLGEVAEEAVGTGAPSVDVVGFSAGGVVARLWVREYKGGGIARRVLTLGSPHHGTGQAELGAGLAGGCPVGCQQLMRDSDLLRRLNAGDETPVGPAWATVRTTADQVVTPVDSAALEGALNLVVQDLCPGSTAAHGDLTRHPVVLAALGSVLGSGPPAAPSRVRC